MIRPRHPLIPEVYEQRAFYRRLVKGARQELKLTLTARYPVPGQKFMIFAQGRTGSTLVTSTLDTHPNIHCDDEILIVPRLRPLAFVETASRSAPADAYGFHVKITQLLAWQRVRNVNGFLMHMRQAGWKIIFLRRENILRQVVSNVFAEAIGGYHIKNEDKCRPEKIELPLKRLEQELTIRTELGRAERTALQGIEHLELSYERDLQSADNQARTFDRLQDMIGVPRADLTPRLRKMVISPLPQLIANYGEVADWIRRHPEYLPHLDS